MRRVLRHILTATALLGVTTGQGNGLSSGLIKPASSTKVAVSAGVSASMSIPSLSVSVSVKPLVSIDASAAIKLSLPSASIKTSLPSVSIKPSLPSTSVKPVASASAALAVGVDLNLSLGTGKSALSNIANANPSSGPGNLLAGLNNVVGGVGGVVGGVASGVGGAVAAVATPVVSGVRNVASGAAQVVSAVGDTAGAAVAIVPPVVSGVDNAVTGLGNTVGITAVGATGLVGDLLDVTLGTVFDVVTAATFALLSSQPIQVADDLVAAILHPHPRDPKYRGWLYFGCFYPNFYLSAKATIKIPPVGLTVSAKVCIDLCVQDAQDFAIVRGNNCYCSNEAPGIDSGTDKNIGTDQCNLLCTNSVTEFCGGSGSGDNAAVTIYRRVVSLLPLLAPVYPPENWAYSSCFYLSTWLSLLTSSNSITAPSGGTDGIACTTFCYVTSLSYLTAVVSGGKCYCSTLSVSASISANVLAGIGECSTPCASKADETCGGTSKLGASLAVAYSRRAAPPSTAPPVWNSTGPLGWKRWGCYYGAAYLLDTILTGVQISSLLDLTPDMNGSKCVTACKAKSFKYAMTIAGVCFCNSKPPRPDMLPGDQRK